VLHVNVGGPASYFLNYDWGRPGGWAPFSNSSEFKPLICLLLTATAYQYAAVLPAAVAGVGLHVDTTAYVF